MPSDILIIDDEADIRGLVSGILEDEGHGTRTAGDTDKALAEIAMRRPNLVFLDIWLTGSRIDGLTLLDMIKVLEQALGREAQKVFRDLQPGDVPETYADVEELEAAVNYRPATPIEIGIPRFVEWYRGFYGG